MLRSLDICHFAANVMAQRWVVDSPLRDMRGIGVPVIEGDHKRLGIHARG